MIVKSDAPQVKRLFDMDIDEISLVKRAANRHAVVSFAKNDSEEDQMSVLFDIEGDVVDEDLLEHGDEVFDDDGNEYVFVDEEVEDDSEEVGKFFSPKSMVYGIPGGLTAQRAGLAARKQGRKALNAGKTRSANAKTYVGNSNITARFARNWVKDNPAKAALYGGGGALALTGAGYGLSQMNKSDYEPSLGDALLEELSKSDDSADRDELLAAAVEEIEVAKGMAADAQANADLEHDLRVEEAFISKAATYNLPISPEVLGPILKKASLVLDDVELDVLDQLMDSVGDTLYDEIGVIGDSDNASVMDQVDSASLELVGKSAGEVSGELASAALFDANPALYDEYLLENGI